jgi:hypothetical protein
VLPKSRFFCRKARYRVYDPKRFLNDYVTFMTTPGSHNDTYAESFHRDFFANWAKGVPPEQCSRGTEGHNTAQIGGFVVRYPGRGVAGLMTDCVKHLVRLRVETS